MLYVGMVQISASHNAFSNLYITCTCLAVLHEEATVDMMIVALSACTARVKVLVCMCVCVCVCCEKKLERVQGWEGVCRHPLGSSPASMQSLLRDTSLIGTICV